MSKRICVIEGDDAAPEAVRATVDVLVRMKLDLEFVRPATGEVALARVGTAFPDEARAAIDACDTCLFGATGAKSRAILGYLRTGKQTYANVRPVRWQRGFRSPLQSPAGVDYVIVRENLEEFLAGQEGELAQGGGSYAVKVVTEAGSRRLGIFAVKLALQRQATGKAGRVTVAAKHGLLRRTDGLFVQVVSDIVRQHPGLTLEVLNVDNLARALVAEPQRFDVVVLPNQYGDILSGAAAGTLGGLGLMPSGCYGDGYAYFEPVHGSAPELTGKGTVNPTATMLSAAMMLKYLDKGDAALGLEQAVTKVYEKGVALTPDQGGNATTAQLCQAVLAAMN